MKSDKLQKQWAELDNEQIDAAIAALLEHRHGRRLLWWLLQIGGVGGQPFARNALDTAFNCGTLNVGNQVLDRLIFVSPQGYVNMMKENADERSERDAALARANADVRSDTGTDDADDSGAYEGGTDA